MSYQLKKYVKLSRESKDDPEWVAWWKDLTIADQYYCFGYDTGTGLQLFIEPGPAFDVDVKEAWKRGIEDGTAAKEAANES